MNITDLHIAIVQQDIVWEDKNANFKHLEEVFGKIQQKLDLVILPETFNTGFSPNAKKLAEEPCGETFSWVQSWTERLGAMIIGSWYVLENQGVYNRLFCINSHGVAAHYDKRHTFRLSVEAQIVTGGSGHTVIDVNGWKISPFVCYDLRFPCWVRNHFADGFFDYDIAIYVANWPAIRSKAWQRLLQARSIENLSYTIGVNRVGNDANGTPHSGNSMVVSPNGNVIHQLESGAETLGIFSLKHSNLERYRTKYPFYMDWDNNIIM
ncbi:MAG: nitrilase family protein [Bacteroidales bacterium]|nr:nitrilase family protein [Bacteroidales bacterium]